MIAKINKYYQFESKKNTEQFVEGNRDKIVAYARTLVDPDNEEGYGVDFDHTGEGEDRLSIVYWVSEPSTDADYPDEPDHYWKYAVEIQFLSNMSKKVIAV